MTGLSWTGLRRGSRPVAIRREARVNLAAVEEWLGGDVSRVRESHRSSYDPYQAIQLTQNLRARGLKAIEYVFSRAERRPARGDSLHTLLRERRLSLPDDETLLDELRNVRLRETSPGVLRLDHDADRHDDHAISSGVGGASSARGHSVGRRRYLLLSLPAWALYVRAK